MIDIERYLLLRSGGFVGGHSAVSFKYGAAE